MTAVGERTRTGEISPGAVFMDWRRAVEAAAAVRKQIIGRRVRFAGLFGDGELTGRVTDVVATGVKVKLDGRPAPTILHPDDLVFLP